MRSLNRVTLIGNIGKDAETTFTPTGKSKTKFSVATSRRYKKGEEWVEETDWHNIVAWQAENVAQYILKGTKVYVEGRLQTRSYEKDGVKHWVTEIVSENIILLGGGGGNRSESGDDGVVSRPRGSRQQAADPEDSGRAPIDDDSIPF